MKVKEIDEKKAIIAQFTVICAYPEGFIGETPPVCFGIWDTYAEAENVIIEFLEKWKTVPSKAFSPSLWIEKRYSLDIKV